MSSRKDGNIVNARWCGYMKYEVSTSTTTVTVKVTEVGMHCSANNYKSTNVSAKLVGTSTYSTSGKTAGGNTGSDYGLLTTDRTFTYTRGTSATTKTISFSVTCGGTIAPGTSSGSISVSVPEAYTAPSVKCKAYRVSASEPESKYAPPVDPTGTRGYYEIELSGGKNFTIKNNGQHTIKIKENGVEVSYDLTPYGTNKFYGYTRAGAVPASDRVTITGTIELTALGTTKSVTGTTYIAPISNMIDVTQNCVAIGKVAKDDYGEMSFEVGCPMYLYGHDSKVGTPKSNYSVDAKALASGTSWVNSTCQITLSEGAWIVFASCYMSAPSSGTINTRRGLRIYNVTRAEALYITYNIIEAGNVTSCPHASFPINVQAGGETLRVEVFQNSGKPLNITPRLYAIRIA